MKRTAEAAVAVRPGARTRGPRLRGQESLVCLGIAGLAGAAVLLQHHGAVSAIGLLAYSVVVAHLCAVPWMGLGTGVQLSVGMAAVCGLLSWAQGHLLVLPLLALFSGHFGYLAQRALRKAAVRPEPAGGRARMLARGLQDQGYLEEAFEKMRELPAEGEVLRDLYHLGKAFERRKDYVQAREVFAQLSAQSPQFRDVAARLRRAERLAEVALHAQNLQGSAQSHAPLLEHPARFGRYEVQGELGRGAMGRVYLARDPLIGRRVAVKTLALGAEFSGADLVDARERFFREAESAGRLQHPHIVAIHDVGDDEGMAWIAMELLNGSELSQFCQYGHLLPVEEALDIVARVADALDYAHRHQVVHRDIKPSNVLYDPASDTVKVSDFGIARITDNSKTRTGLVLGTPSFMAPEQIAGHKVDGRCDLYALGVTLFQLLTGTLPLRGDSMGTLMRAIAQEIPPDVRSLRPELPVPVAAVVARALEKHPAARFQTGCEMAGALRDCLVAVPARLARVTEHPLDYDARSDLYEHPMAPLPDTVLDSAATPAARLFAGPGA